MIDQNELIDSYHLGEALKPSALLLGERCGKRGIDLLTARLRERLGASEEDSGWSLWRSAIEEHEQDGHKDGVRHVLVDVCRDALLAICRKHLVDGAAALADVLLSKSPTIARIGIYVCGEQYGSYGGLFWTKAKFEWFVELPYWHEVFWLIKKNFSRFPAADRKRFMRVVNESKGDWKEGTNTQELDSIHRRDLLHPAFGHGDDELDAMYLALVEKHGNVGEHPDFHIYMGGADWIGEKSPVDLDSLARMPDEELFALMKSFLPAANVWGGPSHRGLGENISAAVRGSTHPFPQNMSIFLDVNPTYQHGLLRGLQQRISEDKRSIDWQQALDFMLSISSSQSFVAELSREPTEGFQPNVFWVTSAIADLIKAGAKNEPSGIPKGEIDKAVSLLIHLLKVTKGEQAVTARDAVSQAINSSRGRILETLINIALLIRRDEVSTGLEQSEIWRRIEPIFDIELASSSIGQNAEFATLGALYLPNLHYLSPKWAAANFDLFFPAQNDEAWRCAVQGFSYQHHMYEWIYIALRSAGHLERILQTSDLPDSASSRTVQFIGLAYLQGIEALEPGNCHILWKIVSDHREEELCELCWFFWTMRGGASLTSGKKSKVLDFWFAVSETLHGTRNLNPKLQSALSLLAVYIETPNDRSEKAWMQAAPYAQVSHHGYILVENLLRLAKTAPKVVAKVFKAALTGFIPDYKREGVIACVELLAEQGLLEDAQDICNDYAKLGSQLLKDTYEKLRARAADSQA